MGHWPTEFRKYKEYKDLPKSLTNLSETKTQQTLDVIRGQGVGRDIILRFLGGNWEPWMIQEALATIKADKENIVDRAAVESIPTLEAAKHFRTAVQKHKVPKQAQKQPQIAQIQFTGLRSRFYRDQSSGGITGRFLPPGKILRPSDYRKSQAN